MIGGAAVQVRSILGCSAILAVLALGGCLPAARAAAGDDAATTAPDTVAKDGAAPGDSTAADTAPGADTLADTGTADTEADVAVGPAKGCASDAACANLQVGACKVAKCNLKTGLCLIADAPAASACDGGPCQDNAKCAAGKCTGTAKTCDDGNPCTDDACDAVAGCTHANNNGKCDDGKNCTTSDKCAGGVCAGVPLVCDDKNPCTEDSCNETSGQCNSNKPVAGTVACDQPVSSGAKGVCSSGVCIQDSKAKLCDDLANGNYT